MSGFCGAQSEFRGWRADYAGGSASNLVARSPAKARLRALEAEAEAERLMGRERDPRGTAPSRISGRYEPPLAEASPQRSDAPISRPPSVTPAATVRPGDASEPPMIEMFEGEPLDLNFFIVPGVASPGMIRSTVRKCGFASRARCSRNTVELEAGAGVGPVQPS